MAKALFSFFDILMMEEVGRIVREARKARTTISTASVLEEFSRIYPQLDVSDEEVVQEAILAAAGEGISLEMNAGKSDRRTA